MFSKYDFELLKTVLEDLRYLKNHWHNQHPPDEEIRRNTVILRRLLVENELQKVWKLCGFSKQPSIIVSNFPNAFPNAPTNHPNLVYAQNGGANIGWAVIGQIRIYNKALSDDEIKKHFEDDGQTLNESSTTVALKAFLDGTTMIVKGQQKTRRQLIKYAANLLGGAHFDGENRDENIESIRSQIRIVDRDPVFLEILSIVQSLMASPDIEALMYKCEQILSLNNYQGGAK